MVELTALLYTMFISRWSLLVSPLHPLPTTVIVIGIIISFRYAAFQTIQDGLLSTNIELVLRTFAALVFTTVSVGVLTEQQGEQYEVGKLSSNKVLSILDEEPKLDNLSTEGITTVCSGRYRPHLILRNIYTYTYIIICIMYII